MGSGVNSSGNLTVGNPISGSGNVSGIQLVQI